MRDHVDALISGRAQAPPIATLVGFDMVSAGDGAAEVRLDAGERHHNPMGTVHGGIFGDIADAAMGLAIGSVLDAGAGFTTLELSTRFLRPVVSGELVALGHIVRQGRRVIVAACDVRCGDELVAQATSTCLVTS